jgi:hypothetical protein
VGAPGPPPNRQKASQGGGAERMRTSLLERIFFIEESGDFDNFECLNVPRGVTDRGVLISATPRPIIRKNSDPLDPTCC